MALCAVWPVRLASADGPLQNLTAFRYLSQGERYSPDRLQIPVAAQAAAQ
jgi:hypothetical protein